MANLAAMVLGMEGRSARGSAVAAVLALLAATPAAHAQQPEDDAASAEDAARDEAQRVHDQAREDVPDFRLPPPEWTVRIEPRLWWASPSGTIKLPAASGTGGSSGGGFMDSGNAVDVSRINLDTPRFSAAGAVEFAAERWRFGFSGAAYSLDRDGTVADEGFRLGSVEVSPGEELDVRFEYATFELTVGYEVWTRDFKRSSKVPENAVDISARLVVFGGARVHDVDIDVASIVDGTSAGTDQTFFEPVLGFRVEGELWEDFSLAFQSSVGAWVESDRSVYSFDMQVAFRWEPVRNVEVEVGWRQMLFSMSDGEEGTVEEFEFDGGMAGLFAGVVVRF